MSKRSSTRRGFTLVELLVVIGIIALLIAMLLPSLKKARDQSYRVKCMSNTRQLLTAMVMYSGENKNWLPWSTWDNWTQGVGWCYEKPRVNGSQFLRRDLERGLFWQYLKADEVFRCPAGLTPNDVNKSYNITSYLMNGAVNAFGKWWDSGGNLQSGGTIPANGTPVHFKITDFRNDDVIFIELADRANNGGEAQGVWANDASSYPGEDFTDRHGVGMCIGSLGTHVEYIKRKDWLAEVNKTGRNRAYCTPMSSRGKLISSDGR